MAACHMFEEPTKRYKVQRRAWVADQASYVQIEVSTGMCVCVARVFDGTCILRDCRDWAKSDA